MVCAEEAVGEGGNGNSCRCLLSTESVVQLMIMGGAVMNDVGAVLRSPGRCGEGGEGGEGEEGIGTPAGVCARVSVTVKVPLTLLVPASPSARVELAYLWARHRTSAWLPTVMGSDNSVNSGLQA